MSELVPSGKTPPEQSAKQVPEPQNDSGGEGGMGEQLLNVMMRAVSKADERAAQERVAALRAKHPDGKVDELADMLIKSKCFQTGAIGAVTSATAIIPGLGTVASLTFGIAADIGMTFKLQAELVLEMAALYGHTLSPSEKRSVVMLVTGMSAGANRLLNKAGQEIAQKATERLVQKSISKAIPVLGVAASGGANIVSTYIIGQRAKAYFRLGPDEMGDWDAQVRALTGVDEQKLVTWLSETTERSWHAVSDSVQQATGVVIGAGRSLGEIVVQQASRAGSAATHTGKVLVDGAGTATGAVVRLGKQGGAGLVRAGKWVLRAPVAVGRWVGGLVNKLPFRRRKSSAERNTPTNTP